MTTDDYESELDRHRARCPKCDAVVCAWDVTWEAWRGPGLCGPVLTLSATCVCGDYLNVFLRTAAEKEKVIGGHAFDGDGKVRLREWSALPELLS
jgi:hypothetical protein